MERFIRIYNEAVMDTDRALAMQIIHEALDCGVKPEDIIFGIVIPSIERMIPLLKDPLGTNLAQHFMASQIAAEATDELVPLFGSPPEIVGRMVIGTSHGDFHGLGKRIVAGCLKARMIDVIDLGLSVDPDNFVDQAVETGSSVIGISSMMLHTATGSRGAVAVRALLRDRGLENHIKVVVGGAPYRYDRELYRIVQADAWADNAIEAGRIITALMKEVSA